MKKLLVLITGLVFIIPLLAFCGQEGYSSSSFARLSYVKGDVFIQRAADMGSQEGIVNLPVVEGDRLGTRDGRAEIHFGRKNYLRIDDFTEVDFANLPREEEEQVKIHLLAGSVYLRINFLEAEKGFEIHTPDASFFILEEGLYRFEARENVETELFVYDGSVEAAAEEGSLLVKAQEKLIAANGQFTSDPTYFYASDDDFARWNESRDALLAKSFTRSYLPSELDEYETELADYGHWVYEQPYGYVWVPQVHVYDWRPYFYGRWVWYPIIGWTWVSNEPWGWCVYHYGRWHWRLSLGWYWIPTVRWGPAWVHWYSGYDYIGWCPLSYYNYPGVIINNRFYDRYYDHHYPLNSRALTVIHKHQLQSPHISRLALSQESIRSLGKISLSSRQPGIMPITSRSSLKNSGQEKVLTRSTSGEIKKGSLSRIQSFSRSQTKASNKGNISRQPLRSQGQEPSLRLSPRSIGTSSTSRRISSRGIISSYPKSKAISPSSEKPRLSQSAETARTYPSRALLPKIGGRSPSIREYNFRKVQPRSESSSRERSFQQQKRSLSSQLMRRSPEGRGISSGFSSSLRYFSSPSSAPRVSSFSRSSPSISPRSFSSPRTTISPPSHSNFSSRSSGNFSRSQPSSSGSSRSFSSHSSSARFSKKNN